MAADIEESSQLVVLASDNHNRFTRNIGGEIAAGFADLIRPSDNLPSAAEDGFALERSDAVVNVPRRRDCEGFL
jgi:hypothetical protein